MCPAGFPCRLLMTEFRKKKSTSIEDIYSKKYDFFTKTPIQYTYMHDVPPPDCSGLENPGVCRKLSKGRKSTAGVRSSLPLLILLPYVATGGDQNNTRKKKRLKAKKRQKQQVSHRASTTGQPRRFLQVEILELLWSTAVGAVGSRQYMYSRKI